MKTTLIKGKTWKYVITREKRLGSKKEQYIETEKEMLQEIVYNYASLSSAEKEIYNNLKKKL